MPQMSHILCQTCRPIVLRICIILLGSIVLAAQSVAAQEGACSSNLEISQDYRAAMGKPACTVYGALMMKSKSGDRAGFVEVMVSLDEGSYGAALNNQLGFLAYEQAFSGGNVPNQAAKMLIVTHFTFANLMASYDERSVAEQQIQFLAYAAILNVYMKRT